MSLSKTQLHKTGQSAGFLGRSLGPLIGLPLIENVLKPLVKRILIPLGLTAAASATDAGIPKKIVRSSITTLMISHEEMNDIMKTVNLLKNMVY